MAYSEFTLEIAQKTFQLNTVRSLGLFSEIEPVEPSTYLTMGLARKASLATAIGTEKARSEMIVADVLVDLLAHFDYSISLFSGIDFSVDAEKGLTGVCDFLVSLSPEQFYLDAPIIVLVEAKNLDLKLGIGQCVAEMIAAQHFNAERGNDIPCIYGASTTGVEWLFLKLQGKCLQLDVSTYTIERCDRILGILSSMVAQKA
ncbi:hypothetical protein C6501_08190 [Candidatus Poribacteria bacterium]|nr:MAG: hypothetical protein C6501_08190 [Candidatus Poribacteria bacterium]